MTLPGVSGTQRSMDPGARVPVGVVGAEPHAELLAALEQALPVRFEPGADHAAVVALDGSAPPEGRRAYVVEGGPAPEGFTPNGSAPEVIFSDAQELDRRLRGAVMEDPLAGSATPLEPRDGDVVLAEAPRGAIWVRSGPTDRVAVAPEPLEPGAPLLGLLSAGSWLSLLPLLHFLREVSAPRAWTPPPLRASFLVDDPNLHWTRYGHIRYPELVEHADEHGYHVAFAMVPFDGWLAHPRVARLFRERGDRLSLVFHGNEHLKRELARGRSEDETLAMLAQARRRMSRFERRAGVTVARVMTPPHGACSRETMLELPRAGFETACVSRPYPWLAGPPEGRTLAAWEPATFVTGGTPVVPRIPLDRAPGEIPLRAFLDQPLVIYGHHEDFAGGLDPFARLAGSVNRLGDVSWRDLSAIGRSNFATRLDGGELTVRAFARRLDVEVPREAEALRLELPSPEEEPRWHEAIVGGKRRELHEDGPAWVADAVPVPSGDRVQIAVPHPAPVDPATAPRRRTGPWPVARRVLVEARDRLDPAIRRR